MNRPEPFIPRAVSEVECACGCKTLMTMGWLWGGKHGTPRRYLYGHAPKVSVPVGASGVRKNVKSNIGPEQIEAYFTAQLEHLTKEGAKLKEAAKDLLALAKEKMHAAQAIDEQITKIKSVREQTKEALGRIFATKS